MSRMFHYNGKPMRTWNVWVGCRHDCCYCVEPSSRVLMADLSWKAIGDIEVGEEVMGFSYPGTPRLKKSRVIRIFKRRAYSDLFTLKYDDIEVIATGEHPWLHDRGHWSETRAFAWQGSTLKRILTKPHAYDDNNEYYKLGYLRGMCEGDASIRPEYRDRQHPTYFRLALTDFEALDYIDSILKHYHIEVSRLNFKNSGKPMELLVTGAREKVWSILDLLGREKDDDEYYRGWLAGIYDAEGSFSNCLRISNYDSVIRERIIEYGERLNLSFVEEWGKMCRLRGSTLEFLSVVRPKIKRKANVEGFTRWGRSQTVSVKPRRTNQKGLEVVNLETTTSNYICEGLLSHNCNAKKLALGRLKDSPRYAGGFEPHLVEEEMGKKFRPGAFIFVAYMGDLSFAPVELVREILENIKKQPEVKFLFCTKDPQVYHSWELEYPDNLYLGATIESNFSYNLSKAPAPLQRCMAMMGLQHCHKFISIEPLVNFHLATMVNWMREIRPEIIEVGPDNYHNNLPEPHGVMPEQKAPWKVKWLLEELREFCPNVVEKKGLERLKKGGE